MYKLMNSPYGGPINIVQKTENNIESNTLYFIPFDMNNSDYQQFLEDWKNGAEVLNPDGTPAPYVAPEPK